MSVAAVADDLVIGRDDQIPWGEIPEDNRQFRERVADDPVILGRRTFEMMSDNLPGRIQIVLSRSERSYDTETAYPARSVDEAIEIAESHGAETVYVLGGAKIYSLFLPRLDRMILTRVPGEYEGDAYYPEWDKEEWNLTRETPYEGFTLQEWERK